MSVNDIDSLISDFDVYAIKFQEITGRLLTHEEWIVAGTYLASIQKIKPPIVEWDTFKKFSEAFDKVHPYFMNTFHIPMLVQAIWAEYIGLITSRELDEINKKWRTAK